ncbi:MAG: SAM-dependent methyltransferase [Anaerolineae bacterium]
MQDRRVSLTALVSAYARAYHATHDNPKIFDDFIAAQLFTEQERAFFAKNLAAALPFFDPELAARYPDEASALACVMRIQNAPITLCRSRYTEDCLEQAVAAGVEQYVILGAGLDTFAFRKPTLMNKLQVFEVDHPLMQADKQRRLAALGLEQPAGLHWIPADLTQDLVAALKNSPYDPLKLSFVSWLGVTYYLSHQEIFQTLHTIAGIAPAGSSIIFDYFDADAFVPERAGKLARRVLEILKNAGEPMRTGLAPDTLPSDVAQVGFRLVENLSPGDIEARYFSGRTDGYHAFEQVHLAQARVA